MTFHFPLEYNKYTECVVPLQQVSSVFCTGSFSRVFGVPGQREPRSKLPRDGDTSVSGSSAANSLLQSFLVSFGFALHDLVSPSIGFSARWFHDANAFYYTSFYFIFSFVSSRTRTCHPCTMCSILFRGVCGLRVLFPAFLCCIYRGRKGAGRASQ